MVCQCAAPVIGLVVAWAMAFPDRQVRRIEPMHDGPLLHLLHAALMASSMMLTWQVHRLRKP
jgi:hypothetical protein